MHIYCLCVCVCAYMSDHVYICIYNVVGTLAETVLNLVREETGRLDKQKWTRCIERVRSIQCCCYYHYCYYFYYY